MMDETMAADLCEYSDKLWQKSRDRAIDEALEIIDSWKEFHMGAHKSVLNMIRAEVLALKGGDKE